ncbi:MAG: hypothetical protein K8L99_13075 [Anaerolineae bacterium]|nr:hypothetical protein [Anaerolineae bacterium]
MTELTRIKEGMTVLDVHGDKVGTVKFVKFGDEDPNHPGPETVTADVDTTPDNIIEEVAAVFRDGTELPETIRKRLVRYGYVRIDTGLLSADRFAILDQVVSVTNDEVHLTADGEELVKA